MYHLRRTLIAIVALILTYFAVTTLKRHIDPNTHKSDEEQEDRHWIATSKYFLDRFSCRYFALCGLQHYHPDPAVIPRWKRPDKGHDEVVNDVQDDALWAGWGEATGDAKLSPDEFAGDERVLKEVPQFVLDHAPLIHLYSGEQFMPSHIGEHLLHVSPHLNHTSMGWNESQYTLDNLQDMNEGQRGRYLFLKSEDDVETRPKWLGSTYNAPNPYLDSDLEDSPEAGEPKADPNPNHEFWADPFGQKTSAPFDAKMRSQNYDRKRRDTAGPVEGRSPAPAILIMVDKGHGILDAFWFYFYSYNLGTTVLNIRFGNHVGDWEHSLIRFQNGVPKAVFFSAHSGGTAFSYNSVEKGKGRGREGRPVLYSAVGSHAMYATEGTHPYVLPFGLLADITDKGPLWDPALNYLAYFYNTTITHNADARSIPLSPEPDHMVPISPDFNSSLTPPVPSPNTRSPIAQRQYDSFVPSANNPTAPTGWFWYKGHWGDKFYDLGDERQWRFAGQYHYVNGPLGPRFKNLGRSKVCQSGRSCRILDSIADGGSWLGDKGL